MLHISCTSVAHRLHWRQLNQNVATNPLLTAFAPSCVCTVFSLNCSSIVLYLHWTTFTLCCVCGKLFLHCVVFTPSYALYLHRGIRCICTELCVVFASSYFAHSAMFALNCLCTAEGYVPNNTKSCCKLYFALGCISMHGGFECAVIVPGNVKRRKKY